MSKIYVKVKPNISVKEAVKLMQDKHQSCVLVVDGEDYLEGIVTFGDIRRHGFSSPTEAPITGGEPTPITDVTIYLVSVLCLFVFFEVLGGWKGVGLQLSHVYFTTFAINTQNSASHTTNLQAFAFQELVFLFLKKG
jgi:CBS domain